MGPGGVTISNSIALTHPALIVFQVEKITGLSWDSCVYHLQNKPPAAPHPYPNDAWHVNAHLS